MPCAGRNAAGTVDPIGRAGLASRGGGRHIVILDAVTGIMRRIGKAMRPARMDTSPVGVAATAGGMPAVVASHA